MGIMSVKFLVSVITGTLVSIILFCALMIALCFDVPIKLSLYQIVAYVALGFIFSFIFTYLSDL